MQPYFEAILIVAACCLLAGVGPVLSRKFLANHNLSKHHQVAGLSLTIVGTLYALVLGLIVVNVQGKYDRALAVAQTEANACSDIWNFTRGMDKTARHPIRMCLKNYYQVVQNQPWEEIAAGNRPEESGPPFENLWQAILTLQPANEGESSCYQSCLQAMGELADARSHRVTMPHRNLAPIIWLVICTGGFLIVAFTFLFFIENKKTQIVFTSFVTALIGLCLVLVAIFEHPYLEALNIRTQAFSLRPEVLGDPVEAKTK